MSCLHVLSFIFLRARFIAWSYMGLCRFIVSTTILFHLLSPMQFHGSWFKKSHVGRGVQFFCWWASCSGSIPLQPLPLLLLFFSFVPTLICMFIFIQSRHASPTLPLWGLGIDTVPGILPRSLPWVTNEVYWHYDN